MARRPVIGITCYVEQASWGVWQVPAALLPHAYVRQVRAAGGLPLVVPPEASADPALAERLDGVLLAGGADIDPALYGAAPHPETRILRPDRDAGETALLRAALERDLPVLGVCRGMQLMAVCAGGALHQHLPDVVGHDRHRPAPGVRGGHAVRLAPGSLVGRALGPAAWVSSHHHQGVARTGSLTATGWAEDGTVEAVERSDRRFVVGVLWHPELGEDPRLFEALVAAAG